MKRISLMASAILLSTFFACTDAPKSQEATAETAVEVNQEAQAQGSKELAIDTENSEITWLGTKPTGQHNGTIAIKEGMLLVENGELKGGTITIDMNTITVKDIEDAESNSKLTGHLKSADFFNVEKYPTATFTIASVEKVDPATIDIPEGEYSTQNPTHKVTGNLKMLETEKSITFYANIDTASADMIAANAKFNIDRTAWNIVYGKEGDPSLGDKFIHNKMNIGFSIKTKPAVN